MIPTTVPHTAIAASATAAILLLVGVGCSASTVVTDPDQAGGPAAFGKADITDHVAIHGELELDATDLLTGHFIEDGEQHGYTLRVAAGAEVTLQVHSHKILPPPGLPPNPPGVVLPSNGVETNLAIYGPGSVVTGFGTDQSFPNGQTYATDPAVTATFPDAGTYLVVVRTPFDAGRGGYNIGASCNNGACAPAVAASCPASFAYDLRDYVHDILNEYQCTVDAADVIDLALQEAAYIFYYGHCGGSGARPDWCSSSWPEFSATYLALCRAELEAELPPIATAFDLSVDSASSDRLTEIAVRADEVDLEYWSATAARIDDLDDLTIERAIVTAMTDTEHWCTMETVLEDVSLIDTLQVEGIDDFLAAAVDAAGSDHYLVASFGGPIDFGGQLSTYVILFPEARYLVTLTMVNGVP